MKVAEGGSVYVYGMSGASIFIFIEHADHNSCLLQVSHDHINRGHVLYDVASPARSPEIQPTGGSVTCAVADSNIAHPAGGFAADSYAATARVEGAIRH